MLLHTGGLRGKTCVVSEYSIIQAETAGWLKTEVMSCIKGFSCFMSIALTRKAAF